MIRRAGVPLLLLVVVAGSVAFFVPPASAQELPTWGGGWWVKCTSYTPWYCGAGETPTAGGSSTDSGNFNLFPNNPLLGSPTTPTSLATTPTTVPYNVAIQGAITSDNWTLDIPSWGAFPGNYGFNVGGAAPTGWTVSGGVLSDTSEANGINTWSLPAPTGDVTVEVTAKYQAGHGGTGGDIYYSTYWTVANTARWVDMSIHSNGVYMGDNGTQTIAWSGNTSIFHVYRVTLVGNIATLYVDGVQAYQRTVQRSGSQGLIFGQGTSATWGRWALSSYRWGAGAILPGSATSNAPSSSVGVATPPTTTARPADTTHTDETATPWSTLANRFSSVIGGLGDRLMSGFGNLTSTVTGGLADLGNRVVGSVKWMADRLDSGLQHIHEAVSGGFKWLGDLNTVLFHDLKQVLTSGLQGVIWAIGGVASITTTVAEQVYALPGRIVAGLETLYTTLFVPDVGPAAANLLESCETAFPCSWGIELQDGAQALKTALDENTAAECGPTISFAFQGTHTIRFPSPASSGCPGNGIAGARLAGENDAGDLLGYRVLLRTVFAALLWWQFMVAMYRLLPFAKDETMPAEAIG